MQQLINPTTESKGFIEGIKWRGVINASQRTEMQAAQNVSQVFLGLNLKCASCHNSFISDWKLTDAYAFANIFADSSLEINRCDKPTGKYTGPAMLWKQLGSIDSTATTKVKRQQLSENITKPENGRLYRTIVNRIWAQLMGRGLVEPVDVMDNEPWSQDLLDWLAFNFAEGKFDIKELIYLIATSKTYQLPSVGFKDPNKITATDFIFRGMLRKRLSAEQFTDAVIKLISEKQERVVFMLWGNFAKAKVSLIDFDKHLVLMAAHPSPLARGAFFGCKHFSQANRYLVLNGKKEIDWRL